MGIERSGRKPKRQRTTAQRMRGRMKTVFILPDGPPPEAKAKKAAPKPVKAEQPAPPAKPNIAESKKPAAVKKPAAPRKTAAKKSSTKKTDS